MTVRLYHIDPVTDPYGGSRNAAKAAIALREAGVDFQEIHMSREHDLRPANGTYRKTINPNGVTPTLDDDGWLVWESSAVLTYIAEKWSNGSLLPEELKTRARVHQWLAWEGATFQPGLLGVFGLVAGGDTGSDALKLARGVYGQNLSVLDNALASSEFVAGELSIADIALGCVVPIGFHLDVDLKPFPGIVAWLKRLADRASFQAEAVFVADYRAGAANSLV